MKLIKKTFSLIMLLAFGMSYASILHAGLPMSLPAPGQVRETLNLLLKAPHVAGKKITNPIVKGTIALWLATEGIHSSIKKHLSSLPYSKRPKAYRLQKELKDMYHHLESLLKEWEDTCLAKESLSEPNNENNFFVAAVPIDKKDIEKLKKEIALIAKKYSEKTLTMYNNYRSHFFIYSPMRLINPAYFLYHAYNEQVAYNTLQEIEDKDTFNKKDIVNLKNSINYLANFWARSMTEFAWNVIKRYTK